MSTVATTGDCKVKSRRALRNRAKKIFLAQAKKLQSESLDSKVKKTSSKVKKTDTKKGVKEVTKTKVDKDKKLRKPQLEEKLVKREQKQTVSNKALEYLNQWHNDR